MKLLLSIIVILALALVLPFLFYNKKIVFELDERYYNLNDLRKAAISHLTSQGKTCKIISDNILLIDEQKYLLSQRTLNFKAPVQQVVLKKIK